MDTQKSEAAGPKSIAVVALVTAVVSGALLWAFRPTPAGRVAPLLLRVTVEDGAPRLSVMNGATGDYQVEIYGGSTSGAEGGEPVPAIRIKSQFRGALSHLSLADVVKSGDRSGTAAQIPLPRARNARLDPGSYVIEIAGRDGAGNGYAGAQSFVVPTASIVPSANAAPSQAQEVQLHPR